MSVSVSPASGGTLTSRDGNLRLQIPPNAVDSEQTITIEPIALTALGPEFAGLDLAAAYELGPSGLQFAVPIEVRLQLDANPVVDANTLSGELQFLLTSDGNQPAPLDSPALVVDADAPGITLSGKLSHFSPLAVSKIPSPDTITLTVTNVPTQWTVGDSRLVNLTWSSQVFDSRGEPDYTDNDFAKTRSYFLLDGTNPLTTLVKQPRQGVYEYAADLSYSCTAPGNGIYEAIATTTVYDPNDLLGAVYLFDKQNTNVLFEIHKTVSCASSATGGGSGAIPQTGIFPMPAGLTKPEAVVAGFISGVLGLNQQLVALLSGMEGSAMVDLSTGGLVLDRTSATRIDPLFGATMVIQALAATQTAVALFEYGTGLFGGSLANYDPLNNDFYPMVNLTNGIVYDAQPVGGSLASEEMSYAGENGVGLIKLDATSGLYDYTPLANDLSLFGYRTPRSAVGVEVNGPVLALASGSDSRLYQVERDGTATDAGVMLPADMRKVRCVEADNPGNPWFCMATEFVDALGLSHMWAFLWDGLNLPTQVGNPVEVGSGPVTPALYRFTDGNVAAATTGFNDDTITLATFGPNGDWLATNTAAAPGGCTAPAHVEFIENPNDTDAPYLIGTCYSSNQYFVGAVTRQQLKLSVSF